MLSHFMDVARFISLGTATANYLAPFSASSTSQISLYYGRYHASTM